MDLSAQISIIATFAALASALGTVLTLLRLRLSEQANFFLTMTARYNEPVMQEALSKLVQWYKENPRDFAERWASGMSSGAPEASTLDSYRRCVDRYFTDVSRLYQAGYIDKKLAALAINFAGLNVWYDVARPMGITYYKFPDEHLEVLRRIQPKFYTGEIR